MDGSIGSTPLGFYICYSLHVGGYIQGDQFKMGVFFWYLGKSDLPSVHVYSSVHWMQITFYKVPEKHGHV